ncbi:diguanylate cyclase [Eubacteriales bacterium OttesenSCG-928-M02]|nr:diguanylate cyclase [Eubacteriales bacterium OttesenSCG-928-M02]
MTLTVMDFVSLFLASLNLFILSWLFFCYFPYHKRLVPQLGKMLFTIGVCLCQGILAVFCYLLPDGPLFDGIVTILIPLSQTLNILFSQLVLRLTGSNSPRALRLQRWFYLPLLILFALAVTNPLHGLLVQDISKPAIGLGYTLREGVCTVSLSLSTSLIIFFSFFYPIFTRKKSPYRDMRVLWTLVGSILVPSAINVMEFLILEPFGFHYHFVLIFSWIPTAILANVYFSYLRTSRTFALDTTHESYMVFDRWGALVDINEAGQRFCQRHQLGEQPEYAEFLSLLQTADTENLYEYEFEALDGDELRYYSVTSFAISGNLSQYCGNGFLIREITAYQERVSLLNLQATVDPLTGAKNRRYFYEYAQTLLGKEAVAPVTLLMLDIDHFKVINDTYGHNGGDQVLTTLCGICQENIRKNDILFRYGGEEFVILCEEMDEEAGKATAQRVLSAISRAPFETDAGKISVTVSIGGYTFLPNAQDRIEGWIENADHCLYKAKANGRNQVVYWQN